MMSSVWISLSLLYLLQHSVSSDEGVLLSCPDTVSVISGKKVVQNCSIKWKNQSGCKVDDSFLSHSNGTIKCGNDSEPYSCAWDTNSTVNVTIVGEKEDNITVEIVSLLCGVASDEIQVRINVDIETTTTSEVRWHKGEEEILPYLISTILGVLAAVIIVAILSCLIRKYITSKDNQEHTRVSQQSEVV